MDVYYITLKKIEKKCKKMQQKKLKKTEKSGG